MSKLTRQTSRSLASGSSGELGSSIKIKKLVGSGKTKQVETQLKLSSRTRRRRKEELDLFKTSIANSVINLSSHDLDSKSNYSDSKSTLGRKTLTSTLKRTKSKRKEELAAFKAAIATSTSKIMRKPSQHERDILEPKVEEKNPMHDENIPGDSRVLRSRTMRKLSKNRQTDVMRTSFSTLKRGKGKVLMASDRERNHSHSSKTLPRTAPPAPLLVGDLHDALKATHVPPPELEKNSRSSSLSSAFSTLRGWGSSRKNTERSFSNSSLKKEYEKKMDRKEHELEIKRQNYITYMKKRKERMRQTTLGSHGKTLQSQSTLKSGFSEYDVHSNESRSLRWGGESVSDASTTMSEDEDEINLLNEVNMLRDKFKKRQGTKTSKISITEIEQLMQFRLNSPSPTEGGVELIEDNEEPKEKEEEKAPMPLIAKQKSFHEQEIQQEAPQDVNVSGRKVSRVDRLKKRVTGIFRKL